MFVGNSVTDRFEFIYSRAVHSWLPAAGVIFIVFASAVLLIDDFPIQADGLLSIATVGYFDDTPDMLRIFDRLVSKSQQHVPAYFLTLFVWSHAAGWSLTILRLLTVFYGIISLALMYRFGRDLISKEAGFFSMVMLASLTFYNIWYLPIRMYTMFVAAELLLLWLYFRIIQRQKTTTRDYVALGLACWLFLHTQIFSAAILLGLGLYHLLFAAKTRKWRYITAVAALVGVLFLPWIINLVQGAEYYVSNPDRIIGALSPAEMVANVFRLGVNASALFIGLFLLSLKQVLNRDKMSIALWVILIVAIAFYAFITAVVRVADPTRFRYFVPLFPLIILLMVKGLTLLRRWKLLTLCILLFWVASGLLYHRRVAPGYYVRSYDTIPIHLIERRLRDEFRDGDLVTGWTSGLSFDFASDYYGKITDVYFAEHDVDIAIQHTHQLEQVNDEAVTAIVADLAQNRRRIWLTYEPDNRHTARLYPLYQDVLQAGYERCLVDESLSNVVIELRQTSSCA